MVDYYVFVEYLRIVLGQNRYDVGDDDGGDGGGESREEGRLYYQIFIMILRVRDYYFYCTVRNKNSEQFV